MGLGNNTDRHQSGRPRKWLSINHGKVELSENGEKQLFSFVQGHLRSIYTAPRTYNGEQVTKWFIDLEDGEDELYTLSFPYNSGTFKGIILSLASCESLTSGTLVKIEPYQKGNFTNVVVRADGCKLDWVTNELPPVEYITINGRTIKDEGKRMAYITTLTGTINKRASRDENSNIGTDSGDLWQKMRDITNK